MSDAQVSEAIANMFKGLGIRSEYDVPLGARTWYGVGGNAACVVHPESVAQLSEVMQRCAQAHVPVRVLGSGANLLIADSGVPGVVVQLDEPFFKQMRREGNKVTATGGYDLFKLVMATAKEGLAGLERVAGIPASVGGAVRMNAGGSFGDIGSCVSRVQVMSYEGHVYYRDREDLVFGYRHTNIVAPIILEVEFDLEEDDPEVINRQVKEVFFYKKTSQPMADRSAGCAFRNPQPEDEQGETPPPAGKLIDMAGLKGYRIGSAQVSEVHANFMVIADAQNGRADDLLQLIAHVQQVVAEKFGIKLQREVVVWPQD